jgi:ribosomal peptide maturation radical SAM protein 1
MGLEYLRAFPWIDYVVVGEGEDVVPPLVQKIMHHSLSDMPSGVAYRRDGHVRFEPNRQLFTGFNETGPPDYDDYYHQLEQMDTGSAKGLDRILLYEGSRGCWWGEKHHCTFCGLNAQAMEFRSKSPQQVAQDMDFLSNRYDCNRFRFVDNIIDLKYIEGLFGKFAEAHLDLDVFIETKSNLGKRQIQLLAHGGVKSMQPGIESLSAAQLKEMDKGVSPLQNLQCLKWSAYYNVHLSWNILLGFPQETNDDYRTQINLIPSILHLQPPEGVGKLWLERFSPYFKWPERYGLRITGPGLAYQYVYDPRLVDLTKIAYDFEYEIQWKVDPAVYEELMRVVHDWQQRHHSSDKPFLYYAKAMSYVTVYDGRGSQPIKERYEGASAFVIECCNEAPRSIEQIETGLQARSISTSSEDLRQIIGELVQKRLLYGDKERYLTLALPTNSTL